MKHPLDARTLARLAVRYADRGVVGFGLSNDERRGMARDFDRAFAIAREGGLLAAPHGGELSGPAQRAGLPGRPARGADRPRRAGGGGPAAAEAAGRAGRDLRGVPGVQRGAGGLREARGRAAADALRGGGADGAGRGRPAAVRLAAGRPVRDRAHGTTASRTPNWPSWPGSRSAARRRRRTCGGELLAGIDAWLAADGRAGRASGPLAAPSATG